MALITIFVTTPLISALYPPWYQKKIKSWKHGKINWDTGAPIRNKSASTNYEFGLKKRTSSEIRSLLVYLRLDNM